MTDIDSTLARLRHLPVDPRLNLIDAAVLDGLHREQALGGRPTGGLFAAAAGVALVTGILGSTLPGAPARAAPNPLPLGAPAALTPSSLLTITR
jgi:hypothetical protein